MASFQPPEFTYDAQLITPGVDLTLTGVGTPNLTASYGDYGSAGGTKKASCVINIDYSDVSWVRNNNNSITVSGNISTVYLNRTATGVSCNEYQEVTTWFNNQQIFHQLIYTASSGTYNLGVPSKFSVTIPASTNPQTQWVAAIRFKNDNTSTAATPDEFYFGLGIKNPNPPDYLPGATLDSGSLWQSHNRSGGKAHILASTGKWNEMRTTDGLSSAGDPPSIRLSNKWLNQRKLGKE